MLFDDSMGFINFDLYTNLKSDNTPELESPSVGFRKGNLFKNEYVPYKNYDYSKIVPRTPREKLLLEVMELCFAINDLNLYLDLHPHDEKALKTFRRLAEESCAKEMEYVQMYGPINVADGESLQKFNWIDDPWPWQNEGGAKYV